MVERTGMVRVGDALDQRLLEELEQLRVVRDGRRERRAAGTATAADLEWPTAWGEEHIEIRAEVVDLGHAELDLLRAYPREPWASCPGCVEGWVEEQRAGVPYQVPCRCRGVRQLAERINRAELPAAVLLDGWRLESIDWQALERGDGVVPGPDGKPVDRRSKARVVGRAGPETVTVEAAVCRFVDGWKRGRRGLLIQGSNGVGKSHIAGGISVVLLLRGVDVRWVAFSDLLARMKASYDAPGKTEDDVRRRYVGCELLVLEELGGGKWTEWVAGQAEELIYQRHAAGRTTLITTNLTFKHDPDDRHTLVGYVGERANSRLGDCDVLQVRGQDWRRRHLSAANGGIR